MSDSINWQTIIRCSNIKHDVHFNELPKKQTVIQEIYEQTTKRTRSSILCKLRGIKNFHSCFATATGENQFSTMAKQRKYCSCKSKKCKNCSIAINKRWPLWRTMCFAGWCKLLGSEETSSVSKDGSLHPVILCHDHHFNYLCAVISLSAQSPNCQPNYGLKKKMREGNISGTDKNSDNLL